MGGTCPTGRQLGSAGRTECTSASAPTLWAGTLQHATTYLCNGLTSPAKVLRMLCLLSPLSSPSVPSLQAPPPRPPPRPRPPASPPPLLPAQPLHRHPAPAQPPHRPLQPPCPHQALPRRLRPPQHRLQHPRPLPPPLGSPVSTALCPLSAASRSGWGCSSNRMPLRKAAQQCSPPAMLPLSSLPLGLQCVMLPTADGRPSHNKMFQIIT